MIIIGEEEGKGVMVNSHVISDEADGKEENVDDDHVDDSGDDKNTVNRHREFLTTKVYVAGKEEEDGYPSQEMVIYGSSRSSPRSHSAVGGNFDPQVTNTIITIINITNSISLLTSHHISSPH